MPQDARRAVPAAREEDRVHRRIASSARYPAARSASLPAKKPLAHAGSRPRRSRIPSIAEDADSEVELLLVHRTRDRRDPDRRAGGEPPWPRPLLQESQSKVELTEEPVAFAQERPRSAGRSAGFWQPNQSWFKGIRSLAGLPWSRRAKSPERSEGGGARRGSEARARDQASGRGRIRPSRSPVRPPGAGPSHTRGATVVAPSGPVSRILSPVKFSGDLAVPRTPGRGRDHSSGPEVSLGLEQPTRRRPARGGAGRAPSISLFGLAPHGVYRAPAVAGGAVRSYRTVSPLPSSGRSSEGGLFSVALSFASPRPGVTRHAARSEFGLSSPIARGDRVARSEPSRF